MEKKQAYQPYLHIQFTGVAASCHCHVKGVMNRLLFLYNDIDTPKGIAQKMSSRIFSNISNRAFRVWEWDAQ